MVVRRSFRRGGGAAARASTMTETTKTTKTTETTETTETTSAAERGVDRARAVGTPASRRLRSRPLERDSRARFVHRRAPSEACTPPRRLATRARPPSRAPRSPASRAIESHRVHAHLQLASSSPARRTTRARPRARTPPARRRRVPPARRSRSTTRDRRRIPPRAPRADAGHSPWWSARARGPGRRRRGRNRRARYRRRRAWRRR